MSGHMKRGHMKRYQREYLDSSATGTMCKNHRKGKSKSVTQNTSTLAPDPSSSADEEKVTRKAPVLPEKTGAIK